jgi:nitroreductase
MTESPVPDAVRQITRVRQVRRYRDEAVPDELVTTLLDVARWTGSARNTQPWHFVVITDQDQLQAISRLRPPIAWVADVPLAIAIVLDGGGRASETYDEGRVTERIAVAAHLLGLGTGVAWFGDDAQQAEGRRLLAVPEGKVARGVIAVGYPAAANAGGGSSVGGGRKPLSELVSTNTYGG